MLNREKFCDELIDIALSDDCVAVNRETLVPCECGEIACKNCIAYTLNNDHCNFHVIKKWANSEYVEPCPFEKDELVEVSDSGKEWKIRYFSHMEENDPKYAVFTGGYKSTETTDIIHYNYCQKYGTLCGLVKEESKNDK